MLNNFNFILVTLQLGGHIFVNYANPVTNFNSGGTESDTFVFELPKLKDAQNLFDRVSSLSASGRSYGDTSIQNQPLNPSASRRILSQSNSPDKDSIIYPDDISRDSYGNIVTPYTSFVDGTISGTSRPTPEIGVLTDINKDKGQQSTLPFVIPSYADGITQLQGPYKPSPGSSGVAAPLQTLLPPLSSGNYNYPSLTSIFKPTSDNSYQNEIGGSFSAPTPTPTGPTSITTNGHVGSLNNSPNILNPNLQLPSVVPSHQQSAVSNVQPQSLTPPFLGTSTGTFAKPSGPHGSSDFSAIQVSPSSSPQLNAPSSTFPILSNAKPQKDTQFVNQIPFQIKVDNSKYTGGFGGAPGILGEQKTPGYAVKPSINKTPSNGFSNTNSGTNSIQIPIPTQTNNVALNAIPAQTQNTQSSSNFGFNQGIQNTPSVFPLAHDLTPPKPNDQSNVGHSNNNHGSFHFGSAISPIPSHNAQLNNNSKYTGGFGGPPGILSPFDNVKS